MRRRALLAVALAAGCGGALPDPESPGARVVQARCGGCHRVYAPGLMTFEMWKVQVGRMRTEFERRRLPWLTAEEERVMMEYLAAYAGRG